MKRTSQQLLSIGTALLLGLSASQTTLAGDHSRPNLVSEATMDRIVQSSRQHSQLARHDRHHRGSSHSSHRHHRSNHRNDWAGPAIGGLIAGAILANTIDRPRSSHHHYRHYRSNSSYSYRAAKRRCESRYRSYDWETDTIISRHGREILCPYIRDYY